MKPKTIFVGILLSIIFVFISHAQQDDFPVLKGPYLGQKPPGETPQMFAPHIISLKQSVHSSPIFSPDGREVYWCVLGEGEQPICIKIMKQVNGKWSPPAKAPFTSGVDDSNPFFSSDGNRLIYKSYRDNQNALWTVKRQGDSRERTTRLFISYRQSDGSWTDAISMGDEINKVNAAWPWVSPDGKYFFFVSSRNNTDYHYDVYWMDARIIGIFRPEEKQ
jgi:Tol biopolymer transport system component